MLSANHFFIFFAALTLGSGLIALLTSDFRRVALALWLCGFGNGGLYLAMGAEFLAIVQWIVSTLVGIAFIFYSVLFGVNESNRPWKEALFPMISGVGFMAILFFALEKIRFEFTPKNGDLADFGALMVKGYLFPLELVSLTLFLVIVGAGVITRPESRVKLGDEQG